jgi:AraC-like DNA-binding protein
MTTILDYLQVRIPLMVLTIRHESNYIAISVSYRYRLQETEAFVTQVFLSSMYTLVAMVTKHYTLHFENHVLPDTRGIERFINVPVETGHHCNEIRIYAAKHSAQTPDPNKEDQAKHFNDHDLVVKMRIYLLSHANLPITIEDAAIHFHTSVKTLQQRLEASGNNFNDIRLNLHQHTTSPVVDQEDDFEDHSLAVRVRAYLLTQVDQPISAEDAAQQFHMSVRTLRRRLADLGMSFNDIRLQVRMDAATRYLKSSNLSIARISGVVGYSDQASFTRAFQKWCGETPDVVRKKHRQTNKHHE